MSLFSNNITNELTPLQIFYNSIKTFIENEFDQLYKSFDGDFNRIASAYNCVLIKGFNPKFEEYGMYHAWLSCQLVACVDHQNGVISKVLITILYGEDKNICA